MSDQTQPNARRGAPPNATRNAILAAARHAFTSDPAALSIQGVAAEAGVSRQTVHHYFGGLKGLRAALAAEGLDTANAQLSLIHISEPTRLGMISYAVFCLKK